MRSTYVCLVVLLVFALRMISSTVYRRVTLSPYILPSTTLPVPLEDFSQGVENGDTVSVDYKGWLKNTGKVFDQGNISFTVGEGKVIPGWEKQILGMSVGQTKEIEVSPSDAYGEKGMPPVIPPNSTLMFEMHLKSID